MHKETFTIRTAKDIVPCLAWIADHMELGALAVVVSTEANSRSVRQNRLYWLWVTEIASHQGLLKDEIHETLKRKFAVPIFTRDDASYAEMVTAVKAVRKEGMADYAEVMAKQISRLTSTTDFTVEAMSEYLKDIEHYAAAVGAELTFPEDLYGSR